MDSNPINISPSPGKLVSDRNECLQRLLLHYKEQPADQTTTNFVSQIESIIVRETEIIETCSPLLTTVQPEIEIVDLVTPSTIDLTTPPSTAADQNTPDPRPMGNTDDSPLRLSPT